MIFKTKNNQGIFSPIFNCANCLSDCHPKEWQDLQVGKVDQAKDGFGLQLNFQSGEIFESEEICFMSIGRSREGVGVVVAVKLI